ncbi:carbamate kinase [Williamsia sp. R60]
MRIVIALGGNAISPRGAPLTRAAEKLAIEAAAVHLAPLVVHNQVVITYGNGPQVGDLALMAAAEGRDDTFDILGAETEGALGYEFERALRNQLQPGASIATLVTLTQVDADDPAFTRPTKFIGPVYDADTADRLAREHHWTIRPDGPAWRRVVPSPAPLHILETTVISSLSAAGTTVICCGGGGVPVALDKSRQLIGVEAVVDKDLTSSALARGLDADLLVIATDVDAVIDGFGTPRPRSISHAHPDTLAEMSFPAGSMGPKVAAACGFAATGGTSVIGSLADLPNLLEARAGTTIDARYSGITYAELPLMS